MIEEVACLVCRETVEFPKYINTKMYGGEIVCQGCESRLHIKLEDSKVRKYKVVEKSEKNSSKMVELLEELKGIGKNIESKAE